MERTKQICLHLSKSYNVELKHKSIRFNLNVQFNMQALVNAT